MWRFCWKISTQPVTCQPHRIMESGIYQKDYFSYIFTLIKRQYFKSNSIFELKKKKSIDMLMIFSVSKDTPTKWTFLNTAFQFQSKSQQSTPEQKWGYVSKRQHKSVNHVVFSDYPVSKFHTRSLKIIFG